jgi:cytochrome c-type biogenesis protein CcmH/NrfG
MGLALQLGNYFEARGQTDQALASYAHATRLRPDMVPPWLTPP